MISEEHHPSHLSGENSIHSTAQSVLTTLDDSPLSGFHLRAMLTSGMGFFTDAYDLFIIGVVLAILTPIWHLNALQISLLGSTSLIAAAFGSVIFGRLADHLGRKSIYGHTLIVLAISSADRRVSATKVSVPFVHPPVGVVGAPTTNRFS